MLQGSVEAKHLGLILVKVQATKPAEAWSVAGAGVFELMLKENWSTGRYTKGLFVKVCAGTPDPVNTFRLFLLNASASI